MQENWLTRFAAVLCATGGLALFWTFGVFLAVPWREERLLALSSSEFQLLAVPLIAGSAVIWGALHLLAISDRDSTPALYSALRAALLTSSLLAVASGITWATSRMS